MNTRKWLAEFHAWIKQLLCAMRGHSGIELLDDKTSAKYFRFRCKVCGKVGPL